MTGVDEESLGMGVRGSATQGMVLHGHAGRERDRAPSPGGHLERGKRKQETAGAGDDREARESEAWEAQEAGTRGCKVGKAESTYFPRRPLAPLRLGSSSNAPSGPPSLPFPASCPSQTLHATESDAHVELSPSIQDAREALSRWEEAERLRRESVAASGRSVSGETVTKRARSAGGGRQTGSGTEAKGLTIGSTTALEIVRLTSLPIFVLPLQEFPPWRPGQGPVLKFCAAGRVVRRHGIGSSHRVVNGRAPAYAGIQSLRRRANLGRGPLKLLSACLSRE